jgi:hypothetical protein
VDVCRCLSVLKCVDISVCGCVFVGVFGLGVCVCEGVCVCMSVWGCKWLCVVV